MLATEDNDGSKLWKYNTIMDEYIRPGDKINLTINQTISDAKVVSNDEKGLIIKFKDTPDAPDASEYAFPEYLHRGTKIDKAHSPIKSNLSTSVSIQPVTEFVVITLLENMMLVVENKEENYSQGMGDQGMVDSDNKQKPYQPKSYQKNIKYYEGETIIGSISNIKEGEQSKVKISGIYGPDSNWGTYVIFNEDNKKKIHITNYEELKDIHKEELDEIKKTIKIQPKLSLEEKIFMLRYTPKSKSPSDICKLIKDNKSIFDKLHNIEPRILPKRKSPYKHDKLNKGDSYECEQDKPTRKIVTQMATQATKALSGLRSQFTPRTKVSGGKKSKKKHKKRKTQKKNTKLFT